MPRVLIALLVACLAQPSAAATPADTRLPTGEAITCPEPFAGSGRATTYTSLFNQCGLDDGDGMAAAISADQWDGSAHCGECLEVSGPGGTAVVRVVDVCQDCPAGALDLQPAAWEAVAGDTPDLIAVDWRRVACPVGGPIALRLQGSNSFFIKLQVRDHRHGIAGVTLLHPSGAIALPRTTDNHFQSDSLPGPLSSPFDVVVTATTGESRTESVQLVNNLDMPGSGQFVHCTSALFRDGFEAP